MDMSSGSSVSGDSSMSGVSSPSTSGMNMSGSSGMMMYLHFTGGDYLFFKSLAPVSGGALTGASLFLVFLAVAERGLFAGRSLLEARWRQASLDGQDAKVDPGPPFTTTSLLRGPSRRSRFMLARDFIRGILYGLQAFLSYALMLAVMTFQAAYIIAIVAGLALGEMVFGRFASLNAIAVSSQCC
ncbi:unnamed protein product [Peniophora sp. CBMAI 1063]|nr:unnamed protein product [Peniophora sp. CBMAI 1063]